MRLFVAILFNDEVKNALLKSISELKRQTVSGNFTQEGNLHLTLAFIGETNQVSAIRQAIDSTAPDSLSLSIGGFGRFRRGAGDVYWVGIDKNASLSGFADRLASSLRSAGFDIENREYKPHITIGREVVAKSSIELAIPQIIMPVNRISLMKSERIQGKLTYTEIYGKPI